MGEIDFAIGGIIYRQPPKTNLMFCMKTNDYYIIYRKHKILTIDDFYFSFFTTAWMIAFWTIVCFLAFGILLSVSLIIFGEKRISFNEYGMVSYRSIKNYSSVFLISVSKYRESPSIRRIILHEKTQGCQFIFMDE